MIKKPSDPVIYKDFKELEDKYQDLFKKFIILFNRVNVLENNNKIMQNKLNQKIKNVESKIPRR